MIKVVGWWCLRRTLVNLVNASNTLSSLISTYPINRLAKFFKALSHPIRIMIIVLMLDGRAYTKEDIYVVISKFDSTATFMSVDRHVRTLVSYGVIKPYAPVRRGCRGRRPVAYVMTKEAREFMTSLLTFIMSSETLVGIKGVLRQLIARLCLSIIKRAKLRYYFISSGNVNEIKLRIVKEFTEKLVRELTPYVLAQLPREPLRNFDEARDFLIMVSRNPYIRELSPLKILKILKASAINCGSPSECLRDLNEVSLTRKDSVVSLISSLLRRSAHESQCRELVIEVANALRTYMLVNK